MEREMTPQAEWAFARMGQNCVIGQHVSAGENVTLGHNVVVEDGVVIGSNSHIESNTILRSGVALGKDSFVGANCVLGENGMAALTDRMPQDLPLTIGDRALIRSGTMIYAGSEIGTDFQTGHHTTIREKTRIGNHVSAGTLSDIQGNCEIGNYVRIHSNVFISPLSQIDDYAWLFPHVVLTNDPTPPSERFVGVHVHSFAAIAAGAIILPGVDVGQDSLVGAGAVVSRSVEPYTVVVGNPARKVSDIRKIRSRFTGQPVYPWREHFDGHMPWEGIGFEAWYAGLDLAEQRLLETEVQAE